MLLTKNLVEIFVQANQMSPKIAGQLFTYETKRQKIEIKEMKGGKNGYKTRLIFLLLNAAVILLRILSNTTVGNDATSRCRVKTELNLYFMVLGSCLVCAERYRVRSKFPEHFVIFFNDIIHAEKGQNRIVHFTNPLVINIHNKTMLTF